jgi:hypothetical protein
MEIPGLGTCTKDKEFGWYYSEPLPIAVLGGISCRIAIEAYDEDDKQEDFHAAIRNFLSLDESVLKATEPYLFRYYQSIIRLLDPEDYEYLEIQSAPDVWKHVQLGNEPTFKRRPYGDKRIYVSLECECGWEPAHGLQIVFKEGLKVNKIGGYDGHVTNSDAYDDDSLEDVILYD